MLYTHAHADGVTVVFIANALEAGSVIYNLELALIKL